MWQEVFSMALSNGIFACLFVCLLVYLLKDSRAREKKYQSIIDTLSKRLSGIEKIQDDIYEIKEVVVYKKGTQNENH